VTGVRVDPPYTWLGAPQEWPMLTFAGPREWATAVVEDIASDAAEPSTLEQQKGLQDALFLIADDMPKREAVASFIGVVSWGGPLYIADLQINNAEQIAGITLEDYAGVNDPNTERSPDWQPFVTTSGLEGIRCRRYFREGPSNTLVVRVDYVWAVDGEFVRLYMVESDLVLFERIAEDLDALAASVSAVPV
jgi:hypothetical protein